MSSNDTSSHSVLGTAEVSVDHGQPWNNKLRALCDTGSQLNLITKRAVSRLKLQIKKLNVHLLGVELLSSDSNGCVRVTIFIPGHEAIEEKFYVVNKVTRRLPIEPVTINKYSELRDLKFADPNFGSPAEIDALFGINIWVRILKEGVIKTADKMFAAQQTLLGWVLYKRDTDHLATKSGVVHTVTIASERDNTDLINLLTKFWMVEDIPTKHTLTPDETECERIFQMYHSRDAIGRYIVHLPFKKSKINLLGKSKSIALKQFYAMERKMLKNDNFKKEYHEFMRGFEDLGHLSKLDETREAPEEGYYTPHHGVFTSGKFRVVINASCRTSTGVSLNDCQYVGAKLQKDLSLILMNFRKYEFALTADVVKMFRQVEVAESHRKYQKILWRYSPDEPVGVYQFNRVIYGQTAAPFLAVRAMRQCALDYFNQYPVGAKTVLDSYYMDDCLSGADTVKDTITLKTEMTNLMEKGQFELAKWASNKPAIIDSDNPQFLEIQEPEIKSVLGLRWLPHADTFGFQIEPKTPKENWTKREIASQIGKLYDPNGYISPVVVFAKILMQNIWLAKIDWDDHLSLDSPILTNWLKFMHHLPELNKVSIPRWLGMKAIWKSELHTFSDASQDAYAAVVYVKTTNADGIVSIRLVQSKTRVAPIKKLTIPRLELCGAHIAANLTEKVLDEFEDQISTCHFWTDSQIVLIWLKKATHQLKVFVGNRVAEIQTKTIEKGFKWHWVAGESNPADIASRGICPSAMHNHHLWWNGPDWLALPESHWPKQTPQMDETMDEISCEMKTICHVTLQTSLEKHPWYNFKSQRPMIAYKNFKRQNSVPLMSAYGDYQKLLRVQAYVLRAVHNFRNRKTGNVKIGPLSADEISAATIKLIQMDQETTFHSELKMFLEGSHNIHGSLFFDRNLNILRLNGRVTSDNLTLDEQYPILISPKGELAKLLIREAHSRTLHGGVQQVLQLVRQRFWITNARRLARSIIAQCPSCFRYKARWSQQLMAKLPNDRTRPNRPFKNCSIDYLGPVGLSSRLGRNPTITKAYVCVFVCVATRAVHLELVSNASTNQFMQALRRVIARRGPILSIWSDNGTNFVGANNYLQQIYKQQYEWAYGEVANTFQIMWRFNTPYAPHHGGLHEAAVKSTKHHLSRVIGKQNMTFEEYSTLLTQVEACLNSRPIGPLSDDPNDQSALTPAHFLIGEPLITLSEPENLLEVNQNRLLRWQLVQNMYQQFWEKWHKEYVTTLSQRSKWNDQHRNVTIGDLVLIKEDNLAPAFWLLGRVKQTFPDRDGLVRSALIATIHGDYKRPITKLGVLLQEDNDINLSKLNAKSSFANLQVM